MPRGKDPKPKRKLTNADAMDVLFGPFQKAMEAEGITPEYLAKKIKREINAKKTEFVKVKGAVDEKRLNNGTKVVTLSKKTVGMKDGAMIEVAGETLLKTDMIDWGTRQRARMDANKLRGDYPAEKREISGPDGEPLSVQVYLPDNGREDLGLDDED